MTCNCDNINCECTTTATNCDSNDTELGGIKKIIASHMVYNNSARAVKYAKGGCDIIAKGYVPSVRGMLTSNGPKQTGNGQWGVNPVPESEGMDSLNFIFDKKHDG